MNIQSSLFLNFFSRKNPNFLVLYPNPSLVSSKAKGSSCCRHSAILRQHTRAFCGQQLRIFVFLHTKVCPLIVWRLKLSTAAAKRNSRKKGGQNSCLLRVAIQYIQGHYYGKTQKLMSLWSCFRSKTGQWRGSIYVSFNANKQ